MHMKTNFPLCLSILTWLCLALAPATLCRAADNAGEKTGEVVFSISLRGNPSTGHFWSWTASGEGAVRETDIGYKQDNDLPGSPATYEYFFVGEKEGDVILRFVYSQSETEQPKDRVNLYRLTVHPDKRVTLVDTKEGVASRLRPR